MFKLHEHAKADLKIDNSDYKTVVKNIKFTIRKIISSRISGHHNPVEKVIIEKNALDLTLVKKAGRKSSSLNCTRLSIKSLTQAKKWAKPRYSQRKTDDFSKLRFSLPFIYIGAALITI